MSETPRNKAERLALAGAIAPILRDQPESVRARKITLVDKDGNVTGYTTLADVQRTLLARQEIEFEVAPGERPKMVRCQHCGKPVLVKKKGTIPEVCVKGCSHNCFDCGVDVSVESAKKASRRREWPRCPSCSCVHRDKKKTPEERRAAALKASRARDPEKMREVAIARLNGSTPEERSARAREREARLSPEVRAEKARKISEARKRMRKAS